MDGVLDILMSASFWVGAIRIATPYMFGALMRYPLALNHSVMAGLVPAIHVFLPGFMSRLPGTRPGMTSSRIRRCANPCAGAG